MNKIRKKSWRKGFQAILEGKKKFDVRLDDFDVNEGDILVLEEWDEIKKEYTGRKIEKKISYIMRTNETKYWDKNEIDKKGFIVMSLEDV